MPDPIPDEWRKRVVAILRGGVGGKVEVRVRALLDWQALFPGAFEYELRDAIADYLARAQAVGRVVTGMDPPGVTYEFIFEHNQTLIYGKVGLHPPANTVVIIFSSHRPLKGDTL